MAGALEKPFRDLTLVFSTVNIHIKKEVKTTACSNLLMSESLPKYRTVQIKIRLHVLCSLILIYSVCKVISICSFAF